MLDLQKASMWKRISAFLFDGILLGIVAVLLAVGMSAVLGYDDYSATVDAAYEKHGSAYGVDLTMGLKEYETMDEETLEQFNLAYQALSADEEALYAYNMMIRLTVVITSLSLLFAFLVMEFMLPLLLGNGQTLGKKIFGIALMGTDAVRIRPVQLFVRTVLGKYAVETMIPVLIVMMIVMGVIGIAGPLVLLGMVILQIIVCISSRKGALIHDLPAATVAVDMASQMIFESKDALIAYKKAYHAEQAAKQPY